MDWKTALLLAVAVAAKTNPATVIDPGRRVIAGYWHNWASPVTVKLADIPAEYNVVNIAFLENRPASTYEVDFHPDAGIYPDESVFIDEVRLLKAQGRRVQISIGGQNGTVILDTQQKRDVFVSQTIAVVTKYGFDGLDIDLEGPSVGAVHSVDFDDPQNPQISFFIQAVDSIAAHFGDTFWLTAAPETYYVQDAVFAAYGNSNLGAYLPFIYHFRDRLNVLYPQLYNNSDVYLWDETKGNLVLGKSTPDNMVWHCDQLLGGFVTGNGTGPAFPALRQNQVAIGKPACAGAAGSGVSTTDDVSKALRYLIAGTDFGSAYAIRKPDGYGDFRGVMTWSINWDATNNYAFARAAYEILQPLAGEVSVRGSTVQLPAQAPAPRPAASPATLPAGTGQLATFDVRGRRVTLFPAAGLPPGVYFEQAGRSSNCTRLIVAR